MRFEFPVLIDANFQNAKLKLEIKIMAKKVRKILSYFAIFEPAEEGGYNVFFPDFPGCVTFGRTFEETKEKAKEVLELWIEELVSQNQRIPIRIFRPIIDEIKVAAPQRFS